MKNITSAQLSVKPVRKISPLRKLPTGIAIFDVDGTLYTPGKKVLKILSKNKIKLSRSIVHGISSWVLSRMGLISENEFAKRSAKMYGKILAQNPPEYMDQVYHDVSRNRKLHNDGAVELLKEFLTSENA